MKGEDANIELYGYYSIDDEWLPIQVDSNGALVVTV